MKVLLSTSFALFSPLTLFAQGLIHQWDGQNSRNDFGAAISNAGDINNDGIGDVIVGAHRADNNGADSGFAYVYSGVDGSLLYQWNGGNANDRFGNSVSAAGDVNADGFVDVIIAAFLDDNNGPASGSAFVYSGEDGSLIYQWDGQNEWDLFGASVSGIGDINGDGFSDVIVGATHADNNGNDSGSAYVYSGSDGSLIYQWDGQNEGDLFGGSVSTAGDINNDGIGDVIVGAHRADNNGVDSGSAYVYSGADGALLYQWDGQTTNDRFGFAISEAGDVNNDGYGDVIIGAYDADFFNTDNGSAYVYSGADGSLLYQWNGQNTNDKFGVSVSTAGDVDNDGYNDLIIGAKGVDSNRGSAYLHSGINGALLYRWDGQNVDDDWFGCSVAGVDDLNGDGVADVLIGAYGVSNNTGSAYVFSPLNNPPVASDDNLTSPQNYTTTIDALLNDTDPNGDELTIISISAPLHGNASIVNNKIVYTPDTGFSGTDVFMYFIEDYGSNTASATITINITRPEYDITNLIAGQYAHFSISGASPGSSITIGYSLLGAGPTSTSFGVVDMSPPIKTLISLRSDSLGAAWFSPLVPAGASGVTLYTQAKCGSTLSNSLALTVQ